MGVGAAYSEARIKSNYLVACHRTKFSKILCCKPADPFPHATPRISTIVGNLLNRVFFHPHRTQTVCPEFPAAPRVPGAYLFFDLHSTGSKSKPKLLTNPDIEGKSRKSSKCACIFRTDFVDFSTCAPLFLLLHEACDRAACIGHWYPV